MRKHPARVALVAVNAKFIHSNLAIYTLMRYVQELRPPGVSYEITPFEFTIHDNMNHILTEITDTKPEIVGFSCYIWNISLIKNLSSALKKIAPRITVILGGPEVSFDAAALLAECPADIVVCGEGEMTFAQILAGKPLAEIPGITYRESPLPQIRINPPREKITPAEIPFPHTTETLPQNKIIYYESSRGCPFTCGYCLSHNEKPVRFLPLERVFADLDFFLVHRVNQVKFTDRTFNCDRARAMQIWQYLMDHDNHHTNFHFEISADFLDENAFVALQRAPVGLFQFEIGVQSTHIPTLAAIRRDTNTQSALANIAKLKNAPNIHIHLDLIAGLPEETFADFRESFNAVYALKPDMLQLGFLKLIKGSRLRDEAAAHGIIYHDTPPYEVLHTRHITYEELKTLKQIEHALDILYNSGHFKKTLPLFESLFTTPFDFYECFAMYWKQHRYHRASQGLPRVFEILHDFTRLHNNENINLLKYDWYASGNQQNPPTWLYAPTREDLQTINNLYKKTNTPRRHPIVKFDYDPRLTPDKTPAATHPVYLQFIRQGKPRPGAQGKIIHIEKI